ncbi:replicative DNA helicase [Peribacillus sp. SCS-26]|uniref:replicative DNA helicase n=1 Tax=Paraperibacillus marinus TaxID=3115295 RepID=UPI003906B9DD
MQEFGLWNQEAEEALVGSLFLKEELIQDCLIQPQQLFSVKLQRILAAIQAVHKRGQPIDIISVMEEIGPPNLAGIGGIGYLTELAGSVPSAESFSYYQDVVVEYSRRRQMAGIAQGMIEQAAHGDIDKTIAAGIGRLRELEGEQAGGVSGSIQGDLVELYHEFERDSGEWSGIPSGYPKLDALTGGFQESDLIIIGARPSVGKTAFALNLAYRASAHDVCLIFSLEMSKKQLLVRTAGMIAGIDSRKMRNPRRFFEDGDWEKLSRAMGMISKADLQVYDEAGMDVRCIRSAVRKVRRETGGEKRILVVIDYLQLLPGEHRYRQQNRQAEISEISRSLKVMARELNVAVIALSQLSRAVESRQDKRPMLSDLRDSGQIEQDADLIALLYRDDYYHNTDEDSKMEVIIAKQRNGPVGTVKLGFEKEVGRFVG